MVRWMVQVLLLGVVLLTAATQDSEEHKKEEEEYYADVGDGRGPPQNVTVTPGLTSLTVSWDPPDDPPLYYTVTVGSDTQVIHGISVVINNLQPCTAYIISVVSVYLDESPVTYSSGTTLDSVPPPPQSCWFDDITNTTMTLYWQDAYINCAITNHNISWSWDVLWSDEAGSGVATNTGNHIRLRDLSSYTNVTAEVASYTASGYGPSTSCWDVTSQEIPGAPVITSVMPSAQTLHVTWSPPDQVKGVIIQYSINIKNEEGSSSISVDGSVTETEVSNLTKCSTYSVNVVAATEAGWGPPSQDQDTLIGGTVPPSDVQCNLEGDKVRVCWTPSPQECTDVGNVYYNINWHGDVLWSSNEVEDSDVMPWQEQQQCYKLPSSVPYTNYSVCVAVNNEVGDNGCCLQTTPQAAPGPPVITEVTSDSGSAEVTWTPPEEANGVISEYEINFKNDKKPKTEGADGMMTSVTVTDLEECEDYVITVKAKTELDWGDESDSYYTTINGIVAPSEVNCDQKGYTVNVCWTPSPASCSPKPTYIITWEGDMKWTDNNTHVAGSFSMEWENNSSLCHLLDTLVPYTEYIVDVSVPGTNPSTNQRCSSSILVPDAAPGPPVLKDLLVNHTSLLVSWDHPRIENGFIGHYQVFWRDTSRTP
nr:phosphatidylinositol phosphatase PTPRQ-like [Cherax quadricarinatus]